MSTRNQTMIQLFQKKIHQVKPFYIPYVNFKKPRALKVVIFETITPGKFFWHDRHSPNDLRGEFGMKNTISNLENRFSRFSFRFKPSRAARVPKVEFQCQKSWLTQGFFLIVVFYTPKFGNPNRNSGPKFTPKFSRRMSTVTKNTRNYPFMPIFGK